MEESQSPSGSGRNSAQESRPPGLVMTALVGGVLLLLGALLFVELVPVLDCPECKGGTLGVFTLEETPAGRVFSGCPTCEGKNKVTLIKRWRYFKAEDAR